MINHKSKRSINIAGLVLLAGASMALAGCGATSSSSSTIGLSSIVSSSEDTSVSNEALVNAIATAKLNRGSVIASADGSDVLTNAKWVSNLAMTAYSGAIDSAQTVADIVVATQIQIDDGLSVLSLATSTFNAEKENGTKAEVVHAIDLGTSANYAALAKSGISTTGATSITGNVAISPAAGTYLTGFSETLDATNTFSTSSYVTGHLFAYDYASPTPVVLGTATADMQIAYNTGAGILPDYTELFAGDLSGKTMSSGAYQWSNNLLINTDLTLTGNSTDIWVFQIAGTLTQAAGVRVTLAGGALPENIYWIVGDSISMGVEAHIEGTMLGMTNIAMQTNSSINGRLLAQTAITLDSTTVVKPN